MADPLSHPSAPATAVKKTRWLFYGCGTLSALLLVIVGMVVITLWWIQRPIKPVVLSAQEKAAVEEKLQHLGGVNAPAPAPNLGAKAGAPPPVTADDLAESKGQDRTYTPGSKVLKLTEREINGLLNANTDLGQSVRLEFAKDAINAYVAVPIPQDFPYPRLGAKARTATPRPESRRALWLEHPLRGVRSDISAGVLQPPARALRANALFSLGQGWEPPPGHAGTAIQA